MAKGLPEIEVKETFKQRRLRVPGKLDNQVIQFTEFYQQETGSSTKPDENATIVAILRDYLNSNSKFQQYLKSKNKGADAKKAARG